MAEFDLGDIVQGVVVQLKTIGAETLQPAIAALDKLKDSNISLNATMTASVTSANAQTAAILAQAAALDRHTALLQANRDAAKQAADAHNALTIGGINLESMMIRLAVRFVAYQLIIKTVVTEVKNLVAEHEAFGAAAQRMDLLLKGVGTSARAAGDDIEKWATGLASVSNFKASETLGAFDNLLEKTHNLESAMLLTSDAMTIAEATGLKLSEASKKVGDAIDGSLSAIKSLGINLGDVTDAMLKATDQATRESFIHEEVMRQFGTTAENMKAPINAWADLAANIERAWEALKHYLNEKGKPTQPGAPDTPGMAFFKHGMAGLMESTGYYGGDPNSYQGPGGGSFPSQPSPYAQETGGKVLSQGGRDAAATMSADALAKETDKIVKLTDAYNKLDPALDAVGKKRAEIAATYDNEIAAQEKELAVLHKVGDAAAGQRAVIQDHIDDLKKWKIAAEDLASDKILGKAAAKSAALEEAIRKTATEAGDFYDKMVRLADIPEKVVDPLGAALDEENKKWDVLSASSDKWAGKLVDDADHAVSSVMAIGPAIDFYKHKADEAVEANYWDKIAKQADQASTKAIAAIDKMLKEAAKLPAIYGGPVQQAGQAAEDAITAAKASVGQPGGMTQEEFAAFVQLQRQAVQATLTDWEKNAHAAGEEFNRVVKEATSVIGHDFAAIFDGLISGDFGAAIRSIGKEAGKDFGKTASEALMSLLHLSGPNPNDPSTWLGQSTFADAQKVYQGSGLQASNAATAHNISAGIGAAASLYSIATTPGISVGQGALAGAAAGATFGYVGAIVGAVVGGIAAAIAPSASKDYKYGLFEYNAADGVTLGTNKNLSPAEIQQMTQALYKAINDANNAYVEMFAKLGPAMLAQWADMMAGEQFDPSGYIGTAASKNYLKHWQEWLNTGLPAEFTAYVLPLVDEALTGLGASADFISKVNAMAAQMDPKAAATYFGTLFDALRQLSQDMSDLNIPALPVAGGFDFGTNSLWDQARQKTNELFIQSAEPAVEQLKALAAAIPLLTGQDQADAIKQYAALEASIHDQEIAYLQKIQQLSDQVHDSIDKTVQSLELAGFTKTVNGKTKTDYQGEENYLNALYQQDLGKMRAATTPELKAKYEQDAQAVIMQMYGVAQASGNTAAAEQYRLWAISQLKSLGDSFDEQMKTLVTPLDALNKELSDLTAALWALIGNAGGKPNTRPVPVSGRTGPTPPGDGSHTGTRNGGRGDKSGEPPGPGGLPGEYWDGFEWVPRGGIDQVTYPEPGTPGDPYLMSHRTPVSLTGSGSSSTSSTIFLRAAALHAARSADNSDKSVDLLRELRDLAAAAAADGGTPIIVMPNNTSTAFATRVQRAHSGR